MTKEVARKMLNEHIQKDVSNFGFYELPIFDRIAYFKLESHQDKATPTDPEGFSIVPITAEQYSFRHLIKIAYDLQDIPNP